MKKRNGLVLQQPPHHLTGIKGRERESSMSKPQRKVHKRTLHSGARHYLILLSITIAQFILFSVISNSFFSVNTLGNIARQTSGIAFMAVGMTMIILTGGIDLSVGSSMAIAAALAAKAMGALGDGVGSALAGIAITFAVSMAVGAVNGFFIGVLKVSPFMTTLATMSLCRGLALTVTEAQRIVITNKTYSLLGAADVFGKSWLPAVTPAILVTFLAGAFLLYRTTFGRHIYAMGGNLVASQASGINVGRQTVLVYMTAGIFVALAAIATTGRAASVHPYVGSDIGFEVITATVLGGISLTGGKGTLTGSLFGWLMLGVMTTGFGSLSVSPLLIYIVKGILILVAICINNYLGSQSAKKTVVTKKIESGTAHMEAALRHVADNKHRQLTLSHIHKSFPGVKALDDVSLTIKRGSVHALVGENGAGKSTLMKVLSGVYHKDQGEIAVDGIPVDIRNPADSMSLGISVIYQELALVPQLNLIQNIFLGKEVRKKGRFTLNYKEMGQKAKDLLQRFGLPMSVNRKADDCTVGQQQMVEIAKAFSAQSWIIVMDEPTSAITELDKNRLFEIIRELRDHNFAVVYISHRMPEIFEIADEVTVLRDGRHVETKPIGETSETDLVRLMVGRELTDIFSREKFSPGPPVLSVRGLCRHGVFDPISFEVHAHEVLGFAGLMGAGRTEVMRCIFGLDKADAGEIYLSGKKLDIHTPADAIRQGICLVSEDRRNEGIIPEMTIRENISLPSLPWMNRFYVVERQEEKEMADGYIKKLNIKTPGSEQYIGNLSGGNQQKCVLSKWLAREPKLIILDEPTRGIDVGAKAEIHKLIEDLARSGIAVIMISSELPEVINASDRIIVLYEGKVTGEFTDTANVTQEMIMTAATNVPKDQGASA